MPSWNWITPQIALGPAPSASDIRKMSSQGITDVLDLRGEPRQGETGPHPEAYAGTNIRYHYVPMLDRGGVEPASVYDQGVAIIQQAIASGGKILVHCSAGVYRSPSMVYAYLRSTGLLPDEAWATIVRGRPIVNRQYVQYAEAAVSGLPTPSSSSVDHTGTLFAVGLILVGTYWLYRRGVFA